MVKDEPHGTDWPVVYLIEDGNEIYIGETATLYNRLKNHKKNPDREYLENFHYVSDDEFNKSATLDIESWLIQYISADGNYDILNGNGGMQNHDYYERDLYRAKFEKIWEKLQDYSIADRDLVQIKNDDLFKYSPYKSLTDEQIEIVNELFESITSEDRTSTHLIEGEPGTGKTVLATYLIKHLQEKEETKDLQVGLVVPMTSLRRTIEKVFVNTSGLRANMVLGPGEVVNAGYDVLIVDEAHRLKQRKGITNYGAFDNNNKELGLGKNGTQLDWMLMCSDTQILLYDEGQSIRPADVERKKFKNLQADWHILENQMRVEGGREYVQMIDDLFDGSPSECDISGYDFKIYDDICQMVSDIKKKNEEVGLSRVAAGFAWEWKSRHESEVYDIEIDGLQLRWNSTTQNWVNSENAINEVGCIHTVQGYDLNYAGIIVGPDLSYDSEAEEFVVQKENYHDKKGHYGVEDSEELKRYIINVYKTLLTRGIKGTYVYFCDERIKKYFKNEIDM